MPQLIEHIDAIARKKKRAVLFIIFGPLARNPETADIEELVQYRYERDPRRKEVIEWLDAHRIPWLPCGHYADVNWMRSYDGRIYIDVPYDESDPSYRLVCEYLEHADGTPRYADALFCWLPLDIAMRNAHHDEPGFWERWAETF